MKISTVLYVPSPYPAPGKMVFPQHWRPTSDGVLDDVEVNGDIKVYVDFAADVGGDAKARSFKDITLWTRLVGFNPNPNRDGKDKDEMAEVGQFWGSLKAYLAKSVDAANFTNHRSEQLKKIISSLLRS